MLRFGARSPSRRGTIALTDQKPGDFSSGEIRAQIQ